MSPAVAMTTGSVGPTSLVTSPVVSDIASTGGAVWSIGGVVASTGALLSGSPVVDPHATRVAIRSALIKEYDRRIRTSRVKQLGKHGVTCHCGAISAGTMTCHNSGVRGIE